jgi:hypothetical protein
MKNKMYKEYFSNEESYIKNKNRTDKKIKLYKNKFMNNGKGYFWQYFQTFIV